MDMQKLELIFTKIAFSLSAILILCILGKTVIKFLFI